MSKLDSLIPTFQKAGFDLIAVSMDTEERASKTKAERGLGTLRVGYGLPLDVAKQWGLYLSQAIRDTEAPVFCEPGLFWIRPDGRLYMLDVSNMPWARPDVEFLASKNPFAVENGYPARGTFTG